MGSLDGLLKRCKEEVGYIEKSSAKNLLDKILNKGTANYTKYSEDINKLGLKGCQGQPWCATYQFWQEIQEFGLETALKHWNMTKSTYVGYNCFSTYNKFNAAGKVSKTPQLGALVIFTSSHMGRVTKISGNTFYTNEGNTSAKTYDRNGGMVAEKSYSITDSKIKGFCIIDYEENKTASSTNSATVNTSARNYLMKGDKGSNVKTLQENLNYIGYSCGTADGIFGTKTDTAVRNFQKNNGLTVDGKFGSKSEVKLTALVNSKKNAQNVTQTTTYTKTQFIKDVQSAIGTTADGIVGTKTLSKLVTVSKTKNRKHAVVKPLQKYLNTLGYNCGTADGIAGTKFDAAAKAWAKANGCVADGEFSKNGKSWRKILGVL